MKRWISGLMALLGLSGLSAGIYARMQSEATWPPIPFIRTWWMVFAAVGAALMLAGVVLLWMDLKRGKPQIDKPETDLSAMADNEDIKSRVRDLLRRAWGGPLLALLLCALPLAAVHVPVHWVLRPFQLTQTALSAIIEDLAVDFGDLRLGMLMILAGSMPDLTPLLAVLPGLAVLLTAMVLVFEPLLVSRAQYFLRLLCGRRPSPLEVYSCFSAEYGRALGGMAYRALWTFLWALVAFVAPIGLYGAGMWAINAFPEALNSHLMTILPILAGVTLTWLAVFTLVFINRMLAYCMTPSVLATQRGLPAHRALRASRILMRGQKLRMLGLWLSFLYYLLPAIASAILLPLLGQLSGVLGFSEILTVSLRKFFWILMGANALLLFYVTPLAYTSFYAYFLERKRELLDTDPAMTAVLGARPRDPV